MKNLGLIAGKAAFEAIQEKGLQPNMIKVLAGAAGGPKWIVLHQIDTFLFGEWFKGRTEPLYLLGSSIGAWRFISALSHTDPLEGLAQFKEAYFNQKFSEKPSPQEISDTARKIVAMLLTPQNIPNVLQHPYGRMHIVTARAKGLMAYEQKLIQGLGLLQTFLFNAMSRNLLKFLFDRVVIEDPRNSRELYKKEIFASHTAKLTTENIQQAILATGSIPLVLEGIQEIQGAPTGIYRDGGLVDYHLAMPYQLESHEIVLQPHFFRQVKPGWFDKKLKGRKPTDQHKNHVLLAFPKQEFIDKLPKAKIPDRTDFEKLSFEERLAYWDTVYERCKVLGYEFQEAVESGTIRDHVQLWED